MASTGISDAGVSSAAGSAVSTFGAPVSVSMVYGGSDIVTNDYGIQHLLVRLFHRKLAGLAL